MVSQRAQQVKSLVDYESWPQHDVGKERLYFRNLSLADEDLDGWHTLSSRRSALPSGIVLGRSTWSRGEGADDLFLVETYECPTRESARNILLELLAQFQLPRVFTSDHAAAGLILVDDGEENALVTVGNLVLRFTNGSDSRVSIPVREVSRAIVERITSRPGVDAEFAAAASEASNQISLGEHLSLSSPDPSAVTGATADAVSELRVFSTGGDVLVEGDELVFVPDGPGNGSIDCYTIDDDSTTCIRIGVEVIESS